MKTINKYFLAGLLFFISACSTLPDESTTNVEWEKHNFLLSKILSFQATGKIGYRGPNDTVSLSFHWKHSEQKSELRLFNVLGSTVLKLTMTPEGSTVITNNDQVIKDQDANRLFAKLTGMVFPVSQMKDWIKGLPNQADSYIFNNTNTVQSLTKQSNGRMWTLTYNRYQDHQGLPLPYQMTLNSSDTQIKIIVSKWILNS